MEKIIYYFSGTGNSLRTARIIAAQTGGAKLISMRNDPEAVSAANAEMIGFVCPVYEWDVPKTVEAFVQRLEINPQAYTFMVATYIAVHGRCFETIDTVLRAKGARLHYGRALRCVASQCTAYEPFPPARLMVPLAEKNARKIGREIAAGKLRKYPPMSPVSKQLYPKMMAPFLKVQHEYDKGFFVSDACIGCEICRRVCPCQNITFSEKRPVWNHACEGCNACVVYCPTKAIQFQTPDAYVRLDNVITRKLGLPETRTRYHNPYVQAADLIRDGEYLRPVETITSALVRRLLPRRRADGHKGDFGKVYVCGGAAGYTGAPVYAAEAAARCGSGLVFAGVPEEVYSIVAARCDTAMAQPLPSDYAGILERMRRCDAVCIGPGLGRAERTEQMVLSLLRDLPCPVVLDADGINAAAAHIDILSERNGVTVLTPHEGEFARLGGDLSRGRAPAAAAFARQYGCILVLKGPGTIVAAPDGCLLRNTTGNCGMAKGGSGDVLAGMVLSLLGQGADAFDAAVCAVWLHGRAGDRCARELTEYAMTPGDMIARLSAAFRDLGLEE